MSLILLCFCLYLLSVGGLHFERAEKGVYPTQAAVTSWSLNSLLGETFEKTSKLIRRLLRLVVTDGTGQRAAAEGYVVGGKTGTTEKIIGQKYNNKKIHISSFIGAFPMNEPQYVVFGMIEEPNVEKKKNVRATGGRVAAPVVGKVIKRIAPLLGIIAVDEHETTLERQLTIDLTVQKKGKRHLASF